MSAVEAEAVSAPPTATPSFVVNLHCPLSRALLIVPIVANDGYFYEEEQFEEWVHLSRDKDGPFKSPVTGVIMDTSCRRVHSLGSAIEAMVVTDGVITGQDAEDWKKGKEKLERRKEVDKEARANNIKSMCLLGFLFLETGFQKDRSVAKAWLMKAHNKGHSIWWDRSEWIVTLSVWLLREPADRNFRSTALFGKEMMKMDTIHKDAFDNGQVELQEIDEEEFVRRNNSADQVDRVKIIGLLLLEKAASHGFNFAQYMLGKFYYDCTISPDIRVDLQKNTKIKNAEVALEHLKKFLSAEARASGTSMDSGYVPKALEMREKLKKILVIVID